MITDEGRDVQRQARPAYDSALPAALDAAAADGHLGPPVATLRS
ncbi:hypothetical protein [Streptomyces lydicamycinicus]|nr:hypothetical protein [Streptomyces lydicamycinicus]